LNFPPKIFLLPVFASVLSYYIYCCRCWTGGYSVADGGRGVTAAPGCAGPPVPAVPAAAAAAVVVSASELGRVVDWLPRVWHKVNRFLDAISPPHKLDITIGNYSTYDTIRYDITTELYILCSELGVAR